MRIIGNDPNTPRQTQAVASGALSTGDTVVVNGDGTVSTISGASGSVGSPALFEGGNTNFISATYDANAQKVVLFYTDNSNSSYGTSVVGTVSGTSISFGTPVVFNSRSTSYSASAYDANAQKIVVAYRDQGNSNYGTARVGTVSGTSISFGSSAVFESALAYFISVAYDANAQKVLIAYADGGNGTYGTSRVGTISGTSISFGSVAVFNSSNTDTISATYDSNTQKIVIVYRDAGNSSYSTAIVGTISGTSITYGTEVVINSGASGYHSAVYDASAQKVVVGYTDGSNSNYGTAKVGTVSGTSISFGSASVFETANCIYITGAYDSTLGKVVFSYNDAGNSYYGTYVVGTVSGTSISFIAPALFISERANFNSIAYDANADKIVIPYSDNGNSSRGTAVVVTVPSTNLTSNNYIGTAKSGAPDGTGVTINTKGAVDENQTGLTAGQSYYVQADGSITTTAGDPSVFAGTAVSSTKLIVKG